MLNEGNICFFSSPAAMGTINLALAAPCLVSFCGLPPCLSLSAGTVDPWLDAGFLAIPLYPQCTVYSGGAGLGHPLNPLPQPPCASNPVGYLG